MNAVCKCLGVAISVWLGGAWAGSAQGQDEAAETQLDRAGNDEVARIMREFTGRGDLGDGSPPKTPEDTLSSLRLPDDLEVDLVAAEPELTQPIHISFDDHGRMWVVQYRQYPFPAGLKVVRYDQHLRAVFDRVPQAPPNHTPGADCVTVFVDTNGDGRYDASRDVITGLNIATSVAVGHGGIWVTNPPYLLCYPDADGDAEPDGDPVVHLSGFGLEDTHSVANSLMWGPDGWLYGVNGSTTTARIRTHLSDQDPVAYEGQCVWRYHPDRHHFEIFAEGGGNPFGLEMTATGQVLSGTNWGNTRGMHYVQGAYGVKNWGKHGPLTNRFAYGFFNHMPFEGDGRRFTEEFVIYQDTVLPDRYRQQMIAINPLQHVVFASRMLRDGSTYRTEDFESLVTTDDPWFRPVDLTVGPDGNLYMADWYDTRLTHVDPRDNWHKTSGRIYRIAAKDRETTEDAKFESLLPSRTRFKLPEMSNDALLQMLDHPSRWFRLATVEVLSRPDRQVAETELLAILEKDGEPRRLESLWVLARRRGISVLLETPGRLGRLLDASDPDVRRWTWRLLGDAERLPSDRSDAVQAALAEAIEHERESQVRSQMASTAKRLEPALGWFVAKRMLQQDLQQDRQDPHVPLLLWWAVEAHCDANATQIEADFQSDSPLWDSQLVRETILHRLAQRCIVVANDQSFALVTAMLDHAPEDAATQPLLAGVDAGLAESPDVQLPTELRTVLKRVGPDSQHEALMLRLRQREAGAMEEALRTIASTEAPATERVELIEVVANQRPDQALSVLLGRLSDPSIAVRRAALEGVARFEDASIAGRLANAYQSSMDRRTGLRPIAVRILASRAAWAKQLIAEIDALRIPAEMVTPDMVVQMQGHGDPQIDRAVERIWGNVRPTAEEKQAQMVRLAELASAGEADLASGKKIYTERCGKCHRLHGEGGEIGPDLTGYERTNLGFLTLAIADPSAAIREEYSTYQVLTVDGQLLSGLLIDRSPQAVTLRTAEGQTIRVARDDMESLKASPQSLMPENVLEGLSDQQIRDLMHYLMTSP